MRCMIFLCVHPVSSQLGMSSQPNVLVHAHVRSRANLSLLCPCEFRAFLALLRLEDLGLVVEHAVRRWGFLERDELRRVLEVALVHLRVPARPRAVLHELLDVRLPRRRVVLRELVRVVGHPLLGDPEHLPVLRLFFADSAGLLALLGDARDVRTTATNWNSGGGGPIPAGGGGGRRGGANRAGRRRLRTHHDRGRHRFVHTDACRRAYVCPLVAAAHAGFRSICG